MRKYIIELEDKPFHKEDGDFLYRAKGFNSLVFDMTGISKLTPYTEPDFEQIRKEGYEKGWKEAEDNYFEGYSGGYDAGLDDAWEAARKICANWCISDDDLALIFGKGKTIDDIMREFTASEAIEKIRQYEQEEEEIEVGDEVIAASGKAVIIDINDDKDKARYIYSDSTLGFDNICNLSKTGRHFPEIATVLKKMREGQK